MEYKMINLYNLENIVVRYHNGYFNFLGEKNEYVEEPVNITLNKDDDSLLYGYFLEDDYYIPKSILNNSCLILKDDYALIATNVGKKLEFERITKDEAFNIFYNRRNMLKVRGLEKIYKNDSFENFLKELSYNEELLKDYCFEILDRLDKEIVPEREKKILLFKCIRILVDLTYGFFEVDERIMDLSVEPLESLSNKINKFDPIKIINNSLTRLKIDSYNLSDAVKKYSKSMCEIHEYINSNKKVKRYTF